MELPMTPPQAAKELSVPTITVYKWFEAGKLSGEKVKAGHSWRIYIDPASVATKKIEMEAAANRAEMKPMKPSAEEWVKRYQTLIGTVPPLYGAFRQGKCDFSDMVAEARRRFGQL